MIDIKLDAKINDETMKKVDDIIRASEGKPVVFIDIDGTIVTDAGTPNEHVLSLMKYLKDRNATIYLWSVGGTENCTRVAKKYQIEYMIKDYLPKPMISIDDMHYDDYVFLKLHPDQLG